MTPEIEVLGIALGLLFAVVCYLATNLSPGGMITPGWLAVVLVSDLRRIIPMLVVVAVTYVVMLGVRRIVLLYGKRLFATVMMVGVFLQVGVFLFLFDVYPTLFASSTLGFIIPGLIAYQLIRQPVLATVVATTTVTALSYCVMLVGVLLDLLPVNAGPIVIGRFGVSQSIESAPLKLAFVGGIALLGTAVLVASLRRARRRQPRMSPPAAHAPGARTAATVDGAAIPGPATAP